MLDLSHEVGTILGIADRSGRNYVRSLDLHVIDQQSETVQSSQCLAATFFWKSFGAIHARTKPREDLLVEDGRRNTRRAGIDHEPHRVRADVDDR